MSKVKFFSAKKVLSAALALVMTASAMPMAFAAEDEAPLAPTGPVKEGPGSLVDETPTGHYLRLKVDKQEFTFVQTEDDEKFQFSFDLMAKKPDGWNYTYIYGKDEVAANGKTPVQDLIEPIGQKSTVTWADGFLDTGMPGDTFSGASWVNTTVTVDFVADGGEIYDYNPADYTGCAIRFWYDGRENSAWPNNQKTWYSYDIPFKITVLDQRGLLAQLAVAEDLLDKENNYTEEAWSNFMTRYNEALEAKANYDLTQEQITLAADNLAMAIKLLDQTEVDVDLANLKAAVAAAEDKVAEADETGYYVQADVDNLKALISEVKDFIAQNPGIGDREQVVAYTEQLNNLVANLPLAPADYTKLNELKAWAEAFLNDTNQTDKYTPDSVDAVEKAYNDAKLVPDGMTKKDGQKRIDAAASTLESAKNALEERQGAVTNAEIQLAGNDSANSFEGNVIYHMTPWYKTWTSQTVDLKVVTNKDANIASIKWVPANWSEDKPEAKIENYEGDKDDTVTIRPTFGIGPRSFWVKAIVTDVWDTTVETAPIKVRFINYDWQK